jgi:hypothetical protein
MIKRTPKYILCAVLCLVLKHPAFAQASSISGDQDLFQGLWRQECASRNIRTEDFQGAQVSLSESFYSDDLCLGGSLSFISRGTYTLPRAGQMDFEFTGMGLVLRDSRFVEDFNQRQVCGFSDWQLEVEKEISGRTCEIFGSPQRIPAVGDKRYGIYQLKADQLLFGKLSREQNAMSPEKRPTNFDPRPYIRNESLPTLEL